MLRWQAWRQHAPTAACIDGSMPRHACMLAALIFHSFCCNPQCLVHLYFPYFINHLAYPSWCLCDTPVNPGLIAWPYLGCWCSLKPVCGCRHAPLPWLDLLTFVFFFHQTGAVGPERVALIPLVAVPFTSFFSGVQRGVIRWCGFSCLSH